MHSWLKMNTTGFAVLQWPNESVVIDRRRAACGNHMGPTLAARLRQQALHIVSTTCQAISQLGSGITHLAFTEDRARLPIDLETDPQDKSML